ncbi:MAG: patatin-like phospholipase family protein [Alphaproteobacteria bacterium]|nr:patatin-like phospholipase family protein [Alphaproteobacteria bacterium]
MAMGLERSAMRPQQRNPLALLLLGLALLLAACAPPVRNVILTEVNPETGYRFHKIDHGIREDTLVVMTMSGGGTRAAALATGALQGMHLAAFADGARLDQEIDILSSVSGGSVTAAWYALNGYEALPRLKDDFLYQDVIADLFHAGLNPANLARLPTPSYSRIDWLISAFRKRLFTNGETFEALLTPGTRRPFLIVNAGDMTAETVFPFTQDRFDLICSDLAQMEIAQAVAASAAFPLALTAVTLANYSPCPAQDEAWPENPPQWIINPVGSAPYRNVRSRRRALREWEYLNRQYPDDYQDPRRPPTQKDWRRPLPESERRGYIHLLDVGIADNLGLSEPLYLLTSANSAARMVGRDGGDKTLLKGICDGDIRTVLFVTVNARSDKKTELDRKGTPPSISAMLFGTTSTAIDGTTFGLLDRLDTDLRELVTLNGQCQADKLSDLVVLRVPVDFDYIPDPVCRGNFQNIGTTWSLDETLVDALIDAGEALVTAGLNQAKSLIPDSKPAKTVSTFDRLKLTSNSGASLDKACNDLALSLEKHVR